jgi:hypothetical protein
VEVTYLDQTVLIRFPDIEITIASGSLSMRDKLVMLHYLARADGSRLAGRLVTFQELPEGGVYYPTFRRRAVQPLLDNFGASPASISTVAAVLGGQPSGMGDTSVTFYALPRVPLTLVLWRGDEEFPPEGNILFDASISNYLPTEDITILSEIIAWKLVKMARAG